MMTFSGRRWRGLLLLILASIAAVVAHRWLLARFPLSDYISGWFLLLLVVLLSVYNLRKKITVVPLGSSETWLQLHIYGGTFTALVFLLHIDFRVPTGWFEGILGWLFLIVVGSGFVGLALSRILPRRLTTAGGEVIFERIPAIRRRLREDVESLALGSVSETRSATLADFYVENLSWFFAGSRNFWWHVLEVHRPLNRILNEIDDLSRYLNDDEREILDRLAELVRRKDGLDYHYTMQLVLKSWVFVHLALTFCLLLFGAVHVVLVCAFSGGVR